MKGRRGLHLTLLAPLLVAGCAGGWAEAEGSFQVRYFLPAQPWYSGLSADLSWRGELAPELSGGQLDARFGVSGLERQSLQATYSRERTVLLAQYDRVQSVYGSGTRADQTALLFAQQGFDTGDSGLKQVSLSALYTDSSTPEYLYRVLSADLNAGGQFSRALAWTLSTGVTSNDSGLSSYTSGSLNGRLRAGLTHRWEGELPASLGVQASFTATQSRAAGAAGQPDSESGGGSFGLNANGNAALTDRETLNGTARLDSAGSYGTDLNLSSTRLEGWTLGAGLNLSGQWAGGSPDTPATLGYSGSAALTPNPWGLRLGYSGSSGAYGSQSFDAEGQYSQEGLNAQFGAGVTLQRGVQIDPDGTQTPTNLPAYRASLGVSARRGVAGGDQTAPPETLEVQARLTASASPVLTPQGQAEYRSGAALSGRLSYAGGPLQIEMNSSLSYAASAPQQPWSGEFGVQALYALTPDLHLNLSGRFVPAGLSPFQAGLGLRYRF
ncbi:hypothetical protein [Deinococcus sp.]|uniref:hypothetical protein n=1 Tax=Deinococcus sp. TaxID=47478 RepID=UPI003C7BD87C